MYQIGRSKSESFHCGSSNEKNVKQCKFPQQKYLSTSLSLAGSQSLPRSCDYDDLFISVVSGYRMLLVAIVRKRLGLEATLYQILQILSVTIFEKVPILQVFEALDF